MGDLEAEQRRFLRQAIFAVDEIHCTACSASVAAVLQRISGVVAAKASALQHSAEATFDSREADTDMILGALSKAGFPSTLTSVEKLDKDVVVKFRIEGMTCSTCSGAVESVFASIIGVRHASVSLTLQEAKVEFDAELTNEVSYMKY